MRLRAAVLAMALALLGAALGGCAIRTELAEVLQEDADGPAGRLSAGDAVGQTFVALTDGLSRIDVPIVPYDPLPGYSVLFTLRESPTAANRLATVRLRPEGVARVGYTSVRFSPIVPSAGREFYLELRFPDLPPGEQVAYYYAWRDAYPEGQRYVNGVAAAGDLAFRTYSAHTIALDDAARGLLTRLAREWLFFVVYGVLLVSVLLLLALTARHPGTVGTGD